jgi:hypothetical protein
MTPPDTGNVPKVLIDSIPFFEETAFGTFCNSLIRESEQAKPLTFASKPPPEQSAHYKIGDCHFAPLRYASGALT